MSRTNARKDAGMRLLRVGENVRHALSSILARGEIRDDALKGVSITVTEARVSPDLRNASIFVMPLGGFGAGGVPAAEVVVAALNRHSAFIRGEMSRLVTMKYMPKLHFELDASFDEADRIGALLRDPKVQKDIGKAKDGEGRLQIDDDEVER